MERELKKANEEWDRANRLEERAEGLKGELESERSKGFWANLVGW